MNTHQKGNPLRQLREFGQSVWLDDIRRAWLEDGTLAHLIEHDGVCGLTSNPAIFKSAMVDHRDYDAAIDALIERQSTPPEIYETLTIEDVCAAADLLRDVYEKSAGKDGYVSLEVSPYFAYDTQHTVEQARRLWDRVDRPNLMIKVPGTAAGLPAIRALIGSGINVNVTLLFSVDRYHAVADAYVAGLGDALKTGLQLQSIASVASFFISRIDTLVDKKLDTLQSDTARAMRGRAAIACARMAMDCYQLLRSQPRWRDLERQGASPQRLLWASTSTKDPVYSDTKYVAALVCRDTVNTMPIDTLNAWRDHGHPAATLTETVLDARQTVEALGCLGISMLQIAEELEREGVKKFIAPYDATLAAFAARKDANSS